MWAEKGASGGIGSVNVISRVSPGELNAFIVSFSAPGKEDAVE